MNDDFADLIPLFVAECRERVDHLRLALAQVAEDASAAEAAARARRELHTLRGSCRLLDLDAMAELCRRAEELVDHGGAGDALARQIAVLVDEFVGRLEGFERRHSGPGGVT